MRIQRIEELLALHRDGLLKDTIPFWMKHTIDREQGGFLNFLDKDGTLLSTDKPVWVLGRFTWLTATLYNRVEKRQEWLDTSRHGIEFLEKHCFDADGRMFYEVTRDGRPLRKRRYLFTETFGAIAEISRALIKPYGPAVLDCERVKPEVAVLASAVAAWFPFGKRIAGYACEQTVPYATLLMRNHVPFDVVLDDDILDGRLKNYRVVIMPVAGTLTRNMVERIRKFLKGGGHVIVNKPLRIDLPKAVITDYDFSCQRRVSGRDYDKHITADEYQRIMEGYAKQLAPHLASVLRPADASSQRVLTNSLNGGDVQYHFFVNDERTYGPRFGKYKLRQELGVAQTATVSVALDGRPALYDAIMHKSVKYQTVDGRAKFKVRLPAARGKLIAALPEPIWKVQVELSEKAVLGKSVTMRVKVIGKSGNPLKGSLPLRVDVLDPIGRKTEWCKYTTTRRRKQGVCAFTWIPAINDVPGGWTVTVRELISGKKATKNVTVSADR